MPVERDNEPDIRLNISRNPSAGSYSYFCRIDGQSMHGAIPQNDCLADRLSQILNGIPQSKEVLITSAPIRGLAINRNEAFLTPFQLEALVDRLAETRADLRFVLSPKKSTAKQRRRPRHFWL